ncbi:hypothetical protein J6590_035414 [Homalodisca vitripennis]|nr:hypothetical protein J6590_035414 [Homalodisca vitripennis]
MSDYLYRVGDNLTIGQNNRDVENSYMWYRPFEHYSRIFKSRLIYHWESVDNLLLHPLKSVRNIGSRRRDCGYGKYRKCCNNLWPLCVTSSTSVMLLAPQQRQDTLGERRWRQTDTTVGELDRLLQSPLASCATSCVYMVQSHHLA